MNPMNMWQNAQNNWNTWMNGMNNANTWMNMMQQWNNMFNMDAYKKTTENWNSLYNQYQQILNSNWSKMQENMQNGTAQDAYKNMISATESFTKFYELWMPMWKSVQEKTFNMDVYKQWMNPAAYKNLLDQYLGFMPENSRNYVQQMTAMMQQGTKQFTDMAAQNYEQMRAMMGNIMPQMNGQNAFGNMLSGYNQFYNMMTEAAAPFTKMMTPNQQTKTMMEWQDISNRIAVYNIKNAELQYMMYTQGTKVMDKLAENVMNKVQSNEEITSIMALFEEWMNISDKTFVSLFETDEYSKLMAEVSAMQLKLKKDIENQMEKFMVGVPVATRSEMDELYKTIYELKKQVRQMEKMMEIGSEEEETAPKTARRTTTKK
jgi:polyhydroxyalkanoate synthesis regulator phasin